MATTFGVYVSYGQLAVFVSSLAQPFNDWSDQHVAQGFAWRPGSVSFGSLVEAGRHQVEIQLTDTTGALHSHAVRAIDVPFEVPGNGAIEVGSITETVPLTLPAGQFLLRCEFLQSVESSESLVRLTFAREEPHFAIVRADQELTVGGELLTTAQPAVA